jgi:nitrogen fixation protein FixH
MRHARSQGWWYPWIFVAGMGIVIAVNGVMITFAIETFPGLSTDDAYRQGIGYNQTIAAARAQAARGWQVDMRFVPSPDATGDTHGGDLTATFLDRDGHPLSTLDVRATLIRPTHRGDDVDIALERRAEGVYGGRVSLPFPGQWDAWLLARGDAGDYQSTHRIVVP